MAQSNPSQVGLDAFPNTTLRGSCDACTDAKIGCTKEKPTCSRCLRRGETCIYSAVRRAERRATGKQRSVDSLPFATSSLTNAAGRTSHQASVRPELAPKPGDKTIATLSTPLLETAGHTMDPLPEHGVSAESFSVGDTLSNDQHTNLQPVDFDTLLSSWLASPAGDNLSSDYLPHTPWDSVLDHNVSNDGVGLTTDAMDMDAGDYFTKSIFSSQPVPTAAVDRRQSLNWPSSTPMGATDSALGLHEGIDTGMHMDFSGISALESRPTCVAPSCDCFEKSLTLLSDLTPRSTLSRTFKPVTTARASVSFESVMSRNNTAIETVSTVLQCTQIHDHSVALVLRIALGKVLGWYAAAASPTSHRSDMDEDQDMEIDEGVTSVVPLTVQPPLKTGLSTDLATEEPERLACQLVFDKINTVRRLVTQASTQLHTVEAKIGRCQVPAGTRSTVNVAHELLFAGCLFDGVTQVNIAKAMDVSVRERLRELSQNLLETMLAQ